MCLGIDFRGEYQRYDDVHPGASDAEELDTMVRQFMAEEDVETPSDVGTYSYDDILGTVFKLVNSAGLL